ncbi:hypothetical protein [Pseudomonas sp. LB-090624]|uniref:hypothetical protein n=1 Tax=Pseudomonas sp. LB-090624 TaxID=2213079 RepID=UPI0011B43B6D|nr:hypothetical protein [Pseudomonas sp. LB-090624]
MNRLLLPLACSALLATPINAFADTSTTRQQATTQSAREQLDAQRDRITGVDRVSQEAAASNAVIDAPVDTSDAPTQASQP